MTALLVGSLVYSSAAPKLSRESQQAATEESSVASAYQAYLHAWKDRDYAALNRLLSDDYKAIDFKGVVSTKSNEIATAKEDRNYESMNGDVLPGKMNKENCRK